MNQPNLYMNRHCMARVNIALLSIILAVDHMCRRFDGLLLRLQANFCVVVCTVNAIGFSKTLLVMVFQYIAYLPAPPNYPLRYPKYHLIETISTLNTGTLGGAGIVSCSKNLRFPHMAARMGHSKRLVINLIPLETRM